MNKVRNVKVLIVDDPGVKPGSLTHILRSDPEIQVSGSVRDGFEALEFLGTKDADVVLLDFETSGDDCFEITRMIMETQPTPIVVCSRGGDPESAVTVFRSMEAGAVACVEKPTRSHHHDFRERSAHLLQTVKLMSEIKVVHRWPRGKRRSNKSSVIASHRPIEDETISVIGIGASTGGPPVLQVILAALPKDFTPVVLIVQHISPGFLPGLADWLGRTTGMKIHIAAHKLQTQPGHVYLAPDGFQMTVDSCGVIHLSRDEPEKGLRPSVNYLFRSLAESYGPRSVGVLLTGMGKDGAEQLKRMRAQGATTIAQDQESSVVHGMPGEAIALGAATYVFSADKIAPALVALTQQRPIHEGVMS